MREGGGGKVGEICDDSDNSIGFPFILFLDFTFSFAISQAVTLPGPYSS